MSWPITTPDLVAAAIALVTSLILAWILQRRLRRLHPILTALLTTVLLMAILVVMVGGIMVQSLAQIGAEGSGNVTHAAPAVEMLIYGGLQGMLLLVIGFPTALITAFRTRGRPVDP